MKTVSALLLFSILISTSFNVMAQTSTAESTEKAEQITIMIKAMEFEIAEMMRDQEQIGYLYEDSQGKLSAAGQLIEIATNTLAEAKKLTTDEIAKIEEHLQAIEQMHNEVHFMAHSE